MRSKFSGILRVNTIFCLGLLCLLGLTGLSATEASGTTQGGIDWPGFLARHDLVWKRLPDRFESAAYAGNGLLGSMVFTTNGQELKWQMGRSDVAFNTLRIPIGDLVLIPSGKMLSGEMRLDLWNAEVVGTLKTDKGEIHFRTFTHSDQMVNVFETRVVGAERVTWRWDAGLASNPRKRYRKEPLGADDTNAPPITGQTEEIQTSFQPLKPAGGHATAWKQEVIGPDRMVVYASVGYAPAQAAALAEAVGAVEMAARTGLVSLERSHREWWHRFWPESFVSIPDTRLESFYYIQFYKMASATRPGRPAMDLMGPWFRATSWPRIWWNLNIQLAYWPQLTGNRLELGESLCQLIDQGAPALAGNAGKFRNDSAAVARATGYDCVGEVGNELCNLPWVMHNYWLQYRYEMDDRRLREGVFPMLKRAVNYYLHQLRTDPDGTLHIARGFSPEYPDQPGTNADCNIDLALLRWGCQTLLEACARLQLADPQIAQWRDTLDHLTPYPQNENGLMISAAVPFAKSHRHFSHLLMIYPLYIMTPEQPANRELVVKSLKHWMAMPEALAGYSFTGAASISALLGEGDAAAGYLNKLLDSKIPPNTLYVEGGGPCIETPLAAAASVNDMLLSSWGDRIRVFPAVPAKWKDAVFENLRAQGAFLVSAARHNGKTQWVRVKSLASEPCRIRPGLEGVVRATVPMKPLADGTYELDLKKNDEALLFVGQPLPSCEITPCAPESNRRNYYGLSKNP